MWYSVRLELRCMRGALPFLKLDLVSPVLPLVGAGDASGFSNTGKHGLGGVGFAFIDFSWGRLRDFGRAIQTSFLPVLAAGTEEQRSGCDDKKELLSQSLSFTFLLRADVPLGIGRHRLKVSLGACATCR